MCDNPDLTFAGEAHAKASKIAVSIKVLVELNIVGNGLICNVIFLSNFRSPITFLRHDDKIP
jgi:hypothetical protein